MGISRLHINILKQDKQNTPKLPKPDEPAERTQVPGKPDEPAEDQVPGKPAIDADAVAEYQAMIFKEIITKNFEEFNKDIAQKIEEFNK